MNQLRSIAIVPLCAMLALLLPIHSMRAAGGAQATDNSRENAIVQPTAQDQPNDLADCRTAARVRRALIQDDGLSTYAQNVKVIVSRGRVTLEGPVRSDQERLEVAFDASQAAGAEHVVNDMTVV